MQNVTGEGVEEDLRRGEFLAVLLTFVARW